MKSNQTIVAAADEKSVMRVALAASAPATSNERGNGSFMASVGQFAAPIAAAPGEAMELEDGRAEWLGNHTVYNDGLVLAVGLEVGATVMARSTGDRQLPLRALDGWALGQHVAYPFYLLCAMPVH